MEVYLTIIITEAEKNEGLPCIQYVNSNVKGTNVLNLHVFLTTFCKECLAHSFYQQIFFVIDIFPSSINVYFCCGQVFERRNTWAMYESATVTKSYAWLINSTEMPILEASIYCIKYRQCSLDFTVLTKSTQLFRTCYRCWSSVFAYKLLFVWVKSRVRLDFCNAVLETSDDTLNVSAKTDIFLLF